MKFSKGARVVHITSGLSGLVLATMESEDWLLVKLDSGDTRWLDEDNCAEEDD